MVPRILTFYSWLHKVVINKMNEENPSVVDLSKYQKGKKKQALKRDNASVDVNEYGEISIPAKGTNSTRRLPWQYRFFKTMVIFLLLTIFFIGILGR